MNDTPVGQPLPAMPAANQGERFIRLPEVEAKIGAKSSAIYKWQKAGTFPKSIPLPGGRSAWLESEIDAWMKKRIALREAIAA